MYLEEKNNEKIENSFFERLKKAISILINNDIKEVKNQKKHISKKTCIKKRYNKKEKFRRTIRYKHIDYIINDINQSIKKSRSTFLGMSTQNENAMHLFTLELVKIKKNNNLKNDLDIYRDYYVNKSVLDALEYLNNRYKNIVTKVNNKEEFKRVIELKVIEELKEKLIPLSKRY